MPFSPATLEEKPYNMCINCNHIGIDCDGPNFLAMSTERWCEWCRLRKEFLGWSNARVAELAGVSKISVDRVMSGNVKDLRNTTMQAVTKALVNGSWGQYPCSMSTVKETEYVDNPELLERYERLQAALDSIAAEHREEIAAVRADDQRKIDFLRQQVKFKEDQMAAKDKLLSERHAFMVSKDRTIRVLSILLGIAVLVIITALLIDRSDPSLGFIWRAAAAGLTA